MAKSKIQSIPADIKMDLIALGILQRRLRENVVAVERTQRSIIEKLIGVKIDHALLEDLVREHNANAAKLAAKAVRA